MDIQAFRGYYEKLDPKAAKSANPVDDRAITRRELENLAGQPAYERVLAELRELWLAYEDCARKACSKRIPEKWRTSAERTRAITDHEADQVEAYYGGATTPSPR